MRKIELRDVPEIKNLVEGGIIMHNMMVQYRMDNSQTEDPSLYTLTQDEADMLMNELVNVDEAEQEILHEMWQSDPATRSMEEEDRLMDAVVARRRY